MRWACLRVCVRILPPLSVVVERSVREAMSSIQGHVILPRARRSSTCSGGMRAVEQAHRGRRDKGARVEWSHGGDEPGEASFGGSAVSV